MSLKLAKTTIITTVKNATYRSFFLSTKNTANRKNCLSANYAERAYIYDCASLTHADASFCWKGLKSRPFPKQSIKRQLSFFQNKIKVVYKYENIFIA